jgi:hypothetical protein
MLHCFLDILLFYVFERGNKAKSLGWESLHPQRLRVADLQDPESAMLKRYIQIFRHEFQYGWTQWWRLPSHFSTPAHSLSRYAASKPLALDWKCLLNPLASLSENSFRKCLARGMMSSGPLIKGAGTFTLMTPSLK